MPASLRQSLALSAEKYCKRALTAFVGEDDPDFFLFAGIAVEHALKARLASENPAYLGPDRQFRSTVTLVRAAKDIAALPSGTRTIGAAEAFNRAVEIEPALKTHEPSVTELLAFRNGQAHLGVVDASKRRATAVSFFRIINALLKKKPASFWGHQQGLVKTMLDEDAEATAQAVAIKLSAARIRLDDLRALGDQFEAVRESAQRIMQVKQDDRSLALACPVCGENGLLVGANEVVFSMEADDWESRTPEVHLFASRFRCDLCGLDLSGHEEIDEADLPSIVENPSLDPDDYMDIEPDEDVLRGR